MFEVMDILFSINFIDLWLRIIWRVPYILLQYRASFAFSSKKKQNNSWCAFWNIYLYACHTHVKVYALLEVCDNSKESVNIPVLTLFLSQMSYVAKSLILHCMYITYCQEYECSKNETVTNSWTPFLKVFSEGLLCGLNAYGMTHVPVSNHLKRYILHSPYWLAKHL